MGSRIVRTLTNVKDVNKLADHVTSDNDIITDVSGNVYLKNGTKNYIKLSTGGNESLQTDITSLKSENTKLKNRVTELETSNETLTTKVSDLETTNSEQTTKITNLETSNADLITRIEALENPDTTP